MPKCNKTKNACKICLRAVSNKTGLQCQGACQTWVHYECINYTPGKIRDIKAGIIKVSCPCPDCKTTLPKEFRTDTPFSCSNSGCPANSPPKCTNFKCPVNIGISPEKIVQGTSGCALDKCGKSCKKHSHPQLPTLPSTPSIPPCAPQHYPLPSSMTSQSDACITYKKCTSGCTTNDDIPGDIGRGPVSMMPSLAELAKMCDTVSKLTSQINDMMSRMRQAVQDGRDITKCSTKGPRSQCTKPCFCPQNPNSK